MYENKLQKERVPDVVKINKMKFQTCGDSVDQAHSRFDETLINKQDPHNQLKTLKHQRQNIPMEMIQKTQQETKLMQFPIINPIRYRMMKSKKVCKFLNFKRKGSIQCTLLYKIL